MQGAQILQDEAYLQIYRNNEECRATPQMDFYEAIDVDPSYGYAIVVSKNRRERGKPRRM